MNQVLTRWNALPAPDAQQEIHPCNGSRVWVAHMTASRPHETPEALLEASNRVWVSLTPEDWREAFATHPRIGERNAQATPQSLAWSAQEQAPSGEVTATRLAEANRLYEARFDQTFIVCATGKTPEEMLAILNRRLPNTPEEELREAAEQQRQITNLRLQKWLTA